MAHVPEHDPDEEGKCHDVQHSRVKLPVVGDPVGVQNLLGDLQQGETREFCGRLLWGLLRGQGQRRQLLVQAQLQGQLFLRDEDAEVQEILGLHHGGQFPINFPLLERISLQIGQQTEATMRIGFIQFVQVSLDSIICEMLDVLYLLYLCFQGFYILLPFTSGRVYVLCVGLQAGQKTVYFVKKCVAFPEYYDTYHFVGQQCLLFGGQCLHEYPV